MKIFVENCSVPVIGMGGVGKWEDFDNGLKQSNLDAVAAEIYFIILNTVQKSKRVSS